MTFTGHETNLTENLELLKCNQASLGNLLAWSSSRYNEMKKSDVINSIIFHVERGDDCKIEYISGVYSEGAHTGKYNSKFSGGSYTLEIIKGVATLKDEYGGAKVQLEKPAKNRFFIPAKRIHYTQIVPDFSKGIWQHHTDEKKKEIIEEKKARFDKHAVKTGDYEVLGQDLRSFIIEYNGEKSSINKSACTVIERLEKSRRAELLLSDWAGVHATPVLVVGETSQKYRIEALERTKLAGRSRWLDAGEQALVPKTAIRFESPKAEIEPVPEAPQGTPFWQNYQLISQQHPDSVVFYRLGDFYEVMGDKANIVAEELGMSLIGRDVGLAERVPMVGVPAHTLDDYVKKLVSTGHSVSVAHNNMAKVEIFMAVEKTNVVQSEDKKTAKDLLFEQLNDGVKSVLNSEDFKNYLKTSSRLFYNGYSMRNTLLIYLQKPDASYVNGYEAWKEYGRTVNQGAKGAKILIPVYASEREKGGLYGQIKSGLKNELSKNPNAPHVSYRLGQSSFEFIQNRANSLVGVRKDGKDRGFFKSDAELRKFIDNAILGKVPVYFNVSTVFDVKDVVVPEHLWVKRGFTKAEVVTDDNGNPVKNTKGQTKIINTPERQARFVETLGSELAAQDPVKMGRLFSALAEVCVNKGYALEIRTPENDDILKNGAEGYFTSHENYKSLHTEELRESLKSDLPNGVIVINGNLDETTRCSVLLHEMAHGDLHSNVNIEKLADEMGIEKAEITRKLKETQAQAISFGVGSSFGIEDARFSFEYMSAYASGVEMQELNRSLNVIHKEVQTLIKDVHVELDKSGYTPELVEKPDALLDFATIETVTQKNLDFALEQEKVCNSSLNEIAAIYDSFKSAPHGEIEYIVDSAKTNVDNRLELVGIIKDGVHELRNLDTREAQDQCVDKIESAAKNISFAVNAFENLREAYQNANEQINGGLKVEFEKEPKNTLVSLSNDFPKLKELTDTQISYLAASKYVANESFLLRNPDNVGEFVDMACERTNALHKCASKSGIFVEVSFCENFTDKPIFTNGTICHPKAAEDIIIQAEIQLRGIKKEHGARGEYFPYVKCAVSVYFADDAGKLSVTHTRLDLGDGEQTSLQDHLQKCYGGKNNAVLLENFDKALMERGVKEKIFAPNFPEWAESSARAVAIDENTLSFEGFHKELAAFKESSEKATTSQGVQGRDGKFGKDDIS